MTEFPGGGRTPGESNMALGRLSPSSPLSFVSGDRLEYQTIVDSANPLVRFFQKSASILVRFMLIRHQVKLVLLTKYSLLPNPGRTILERITQVRCFFVFALGVTSVCDGTQNFKRYRYRYFIPVPNISDTDTGTFFGTKFFRYRFRDFFPVPISSDTGTDTTQKIKNSRYREFPVPVRHTLRRSQLHSGDCCRWGSQFHYSSLSVESHLVISSSPDDDTHVTLASSQQLIELWFRAA